MLATIGKFFADKFRRLLPDSFIFAILLTFLAAIMAFMFVDAKPFGIVQAWYKGFWILLAFAMQMVLILVTGYAIAISPPAEKFLDWLSTKVKTPVAVYGVVTFMGCVFSLISWGWIVLTAVLGRELSRRVKGVDYRLLAACVYTAFLPWHGGLSGSIPLVLNTPDNFLIKAKVLSETIPTTLTLLSPMNIACSLGLLIVLPALMIMMRPSEQHVVSLDDMVDEEHKAVKPMSVAEEADSLKLPDKNISDLLNNSLVIQVIICLMGLWFLFDHFYSKGFDINLNVMNFLFIIVGMICHKTPFRYVIAMKRACSNVSGIVLQFPFYAGIMGIMIYTGLGKAIAAWIAGFATVGSFPFIAFLIGGFVNIFVPSGGGEWAVVGQPILEAARTLGATMPADQLTAFFARVSMAVAYGDAWTNMIQPFWTLAFFPVIAAGTKMQARDIMGYTFVSLIASFFIFAICVTWVPV
ncbi:MAG: short-chain fatty acid transporter [Deltaproteobacteria bacterium]|nr:short-chain fatty acid transporter [Deltaproteobacteria bacterium]MBN2687934.1 short-chain fatty acid transporter [Deltaproteobacteria bacterium]